MNDDTITIGDDTITIGDDSTIIISGQCLEKPTGRLRRPRGLSPSAVKMYLNEPEKYIEQYLCPTPPPKFKQILPMAVGSAFDSFVKGNISKVLGLRDNTIDLFRSSVELKGEEGELAKYYGWYCFQSYRQCGALASLLLDLKFCDISTLRMENWMEANVPTSRKVIEEIKSICDCDTFETFHVWGKPDLSVMRQLGTGQRVPIILDWKVNGFMSKSSTSPKKGFVRQWHVPDKDVPARHAEEHRDGLWKMKGPHKEVLLGYDRGIMVDLKNELSYCDDEWALQCSTYGWLNGYGIVGKDEDRSLYVGIDQITSWGIDSMADVSAQSLASNWPDTTIGLPSLRISSFRNKVSLATQERFQELYTLVWTITHQSDDEKIKALFYSCHPNMKDVSVAESVERFDSVLRSASYVGGVGSTFLDEGREV